MQLGFVIDQSRCIGCHACTVACKSENDVPLGNFRTWVKYTEDGAFPQVKRSFAVLRCNQCTDAPCVTICPVRALAKRPDGIVDVDPEACIGCKACMQGCPYDALYLNEATGTAEKCHFCVHRTEIGLAPACAVVCPTEAILPGDLDDPESVVGRLRREGGLTARKTEAGTGPNVLYKAAAPAGLEPLSTQGAGGYLWAGRLAGEGLDAEEFQAMEAQAPARTVYDVEHPRIWGGKVSAYLFTKSVSGGLGIAWALLMPVFAGMGWDISTTHVVGFHGTALLFLLLTTGLLVADLKRPERFFYVLTRANWGSWLARGTLVLTVYGGLLSLWILHALLGLSPEGWILRSSFVLAPLFGGLTAAYTAWLFGQAKGRVLWMRSGYAVHLVVQAAVAGTGLALLFSPAASLLAPNLRTGLLFGLVALLVLTLAEKRLAPRGREEEYHRAARLLTHGPYARRHWGLGVGMGLALPLLLLLVPYEPVVLGRIAALAALLGLFVEEDLFVRAGQALRIS